MGGGSRIGRYSRPRFPTRVTENSSRLHSHVQQGKVDQHSLWQKGANQRELNSLLARVLWERRLRERGLNMPEGPRRFFSFRAEGNREEPSKAKVSRERENTDAWQSPEKVTKKLRKRKKPAREKHPMPWWKHGTLWLSILGIPSYVAAHLPRSFFVGLSDRGNSVVIKCVE